MAHLKAPSASLDLTHVLYHENDYLSQALALITLSPILLMASYAALAVQTRELLILNMWAGQLSCEALNWLLKRAIKQERPAYSIGNGYGFPSSHSQYMGYFATFLACHLFFRHRFASTGLPMIDALWRLLVYTGLILWAGAVAYSRYYLTYHSTFQILCGLGIGIAYGALFYLVFEKIPHTWPHSILGRLRSAFLRHPLVSWLEVRDGWAVWADGGRADEWKRWRDQWEALGAGSRRTDQSTAAGKTSVRQGGRKKD